jgi:hypothetical protein
MAHGAVMGRGEHESHANFIDGTAYLLRIQFQGDAQLFQHIGTATGHLDLQSETIACPTLLQTS